MAALAAGLEQDRLRRNRDCDQPSGSAHAFRRTRRISPPPIRPAIDAIGGPQPRERRGARTKLGKKIAPMTTSSDEPQAADPAALDTAYRDAGAATLDAAQQAIVDALLAGNARFLANAPLQHDYSAERVPLAAGQTPVAAILSCADSRVPPELLFDQAPGDLFVVRVAGNLVTAEGLASLEYGVELLGTRLIIILGHTHCGAVGATIDVLRNQTLLPGHVQDLIRNMKPGIARELLSDEPHLETRASVANVRYNVRRLDHSQPILSARVASGDLAILGAIYDLETGRVSLV